MTPGTKGIVPRAPGDPRWFRPERWTPRQSTSPQPRTLPEITACGPDGTIPSAEGYSLENGGRAFQTYLSQSTSRIWSRKAGESTRQRTRGESPTSCS